MEHKFSEISKFRESDKSLNSGGSNPRWVGHQSQGAGHQSIIWQNFQQKMQEIEKNWIEYSVLPLDPAMLKHELRQFKDTVSQRCLVCL